MKKRLLALIVSATLLFVLVASVDQRQLLSYLGEVRPNWFVLGMFLFIPQVLTIAMRWKFMCRRLAPLDLRESGRQILASNSLNLLLPSKLGDLIKGVIIFRQGKCSLSQGMGLVVFEKLLDLAALAAWMIIGWMLVPRTDIWILALLALGIAVVGAVTVTFFRPNNGKSGDGGKETKGLVAKLKRIWTSGPEIRAFAAKNSKESLTLLGASLGIWALHLAQITCFFWALGASMSAFEVFARMPIAIFAGLLPLTIAGVGVRDWALVSIFAGPADPRAMLVGVGFLVSLRYIVPAAAGLFFANRYLGMDEVKKAKSSALRP